MDLKAVLFDLDGTLTRFNIDYRSARRDVNAELVTLGLGEHSLKDGMMLYMMLDNVKGLMPDERFRLFVDKVQSLFERYEIASAASTDLQPYARETLVSLKEQGFKTAIVTNNCLNATKTVINRFGLQPLVDALVTREDAPRWKPDGAMVKETLNRLHIDPGDALFVGDSTIDVMAARDAGVISVALLTGPTLTTRLLKEKPDYLIPSLAELMSLIEKIR
ncbi:MAG: HAD family hydrolase [Thaumarchaeota archaeon]|nr:HAD family hydrolase [Nitrososphaerota archaeon]MCL5317301.1 HAD family hydrolase [Nitrososphaerota archaeon]